MEKDIVAYDAAIRRLEEGNAGYVNSKSERGEKEKGTVSGTNSPFAVVVSCSDMGTAPERIFGCGHGEIASIRVAGNLVDSVVLGSVILAVRRYACPVVVVLGHDACLALNTALSPDEFLIREPAPVIRIAEMLREDAGGPEKNDHDHHDCARSLARAGVARIRDDSFVGERMREGLLRVVPALYLHDAGVVEWLY